jgi:pyruvate/2-oxoglutarate dehydrogenase complex dihydrolipoamide dehydrogenase (E3) component
MGYDLVILGAGSAGYAAAKEAQRLGLRTALIEGGREVGGLCILRGCLPSKTLLESAGRFRAVGRAPEFGVRLEGQPAFVTPEVVARKRRLVERFACERREAIERGGFEFLRGWARFLDERTVEIEPLDGKAPQRLTAETFLIATGSRVKALELPGLREAGFLTSDDLLEAERVPGSVVVLGAGPVGLEAAHYYRAAGAAVTVIEREEQALGALDPDVSLALERAMTAQGVRLFCAAKALRVAREAGGPKRVWFEHDGKERLVEAEEILQAVGREPCVDDLGLEAAGMELDPKGHIATEPTQRSTRRPHIFAAGDAGGPYEILHAAVRQGELAARNAARWLGRLGGEPERVDQRLKLLAVFTEPQVAAVGLSEREAGKAQLDFRTATYSFEDHGRAVLEGETEGLVKLVAERGSGRLLGAAAVGPRAAELIHELVAVLYYRGTAQDVVAMPHYHPTLSEVWTFPAQALAAAGG